MTNPNKWREWNVPLVTLIVNDEAPHGHKKIHVIEAAPALQEIERLRTVISHLPKVPTEPYEKQLAKRIVELETEKIEVARSAVVLIDEVKAQLAEAKAVIEKAAKADCPSYIAHPQSVWSWQICIREKVIRLLGLLILKTNRKQYTYRN